LQKAAPSHLKQYAGAYVQQQIVSSTNINPSHAPTVVSPNRPPVPDPLKLGHSGDIAAEQPNAQFLDLYQPDNPSPTPNPTPTYDFIMNPNQPVNKPPLLGGSFLPMRIALIGGGLVVLMFAFIILRSLLSGGSNVESFVSIAQQQQALLHVIDSAAEQQNLTTSNKNFAATAEISLSSSQDQLIDYLKSNKAKLDVKTLNLKVSTKVDAELEAAAAATTYNETFKEIMKTKLTEYQASLQKIYEAAEGEKGRALLSSDFDQAELLLKQLES
jgi:hypothetical protein